VKQGCNSVWKFLESECKFMSSVNYCNKYLISYGGVSNIFYVSLPPWTSTRYGTKPCDS